MNYKAKLLFELQNYNIKKPDEITYINENDKDKNRLIWYLENGLFALDVVEPNINYLYQVENQKIKIGTLKSIDEVIVLALKFLQ